MGSLYCKKMFVAVKKNKRRGIKTSIRQQTLAHKRPGSEPGRMYLNPP